MTAGRGLQVLHLWLAGKAFVRLAMPTIKVAFLLLSGHTAVTPLFVLDDKLLGSMKFSRRLGILVDL